MNLVHVIEESKDKYHHLCMAFYLIWLDLFCVVYIKREIRLLLYITIWTFFYYYLYRRLIDYSILLSRHYTIETGLKRRLASCVCWFLVFFRGKCLSLRNYMFSLNNFCWILTTDGMICHISILIVIWVMIIERVDWSHRVRGLRFSWL